MGQTLEHAGICVQQLDTQDNQIFTILFNDKQRNKNTPRSSEISIDLALNDEEYAHKLQHKLQVAFNHVQQSREYAVNKAKIVHNRT